jgi:hypothetical protein
MRIRALYLMSLAVFAGVAIAAGSLVLVFWILFGVGALALLVRTVVAEGRPDERSRLLRWSVASMAGHLLLGAIVTFTGAADYIGPDARYYHLAALGILRHWNGSPAFPDISPGKEGFPYLLAASYRLLGPSEFVGLVLNATMAAAMIPLLTEATRRFFGDEPARYAAPAVVLIPGLIVWPAQLLREAGVLFLMSVAAYCAPRIWDGSKLARLIIILFLGLSVALMFTFRSYAATAMAVGLLLGIALNQRSILFGLGTLAATAAVLAAFLIGLGIGERGLRAVTGADLETLSQFQRRSGTGEDIESGFTYGPPIRSPLQALPWLPLAIVRVALGPGPWEIETTRQLPALADAAFVWLSLPFLFAGLHAALFRRSVFTIDSRRLAPWMLVLPASAMALAMALGIGNYGLLIRQRTQISLLMVPFLALGCSILFDRYRSRMARSQPAQAA